MTDREALLSAIIATPEDDLPRLVYADWLEENDRLEICQKCGGNGHYFHRVMAGRDESNMLKWKPFEFDCSKCGGAGSIGNSFADRAAFIRLQIEFAKTENEGRAFVLDLTAGDGSRFNPPEIAFNAVHTAMWSRGFISHISGHLSSLLEHGPAICREHPVESVEVTDKRPLNLDDIIYYPSYWLNEEFSDSGNWSDHAEDDMSNVIPKDVFKLLLHVEGSGSGLATPIPQT